MAATRPPSEVVRRFWEPQLGAIELAAPDAKSVLQEWAQGRRLPLPRYLEVAREGPDHAPRFTAEVQIEGVAPERGQGANKREAEQAAALAVLLREGVWQAPPRWLANADAPDGERAHALRLRGADRRAEQRQVDAHQCAGRRQGLDRHPQGADHARARARHRADRRRRK